MPPSGVRGMNGRSRASESSRRHLCDSAGADGVCVEGAFGPAQGSDRAECVGDGHGGGADLAEVQAGQDARAAGGLVGDDVEPPAVDLSGDADAPGGPDDGPCGRPDRSCDPGARVSPRGASGPPVRSRLAWKPPAETLKLWDVATGREIAAMVAFEGGEGRTDDWVVMLPSGYLDCSPGGIKYVNVRVGTGDNVVGVEPDHLDLRDPARVRRALSGQAK